MFKGVPGSDDGQDLQGRSNLKQGHVTAIDPAKGLVRVECSDNDGMETYWLQVLYPKTHVDKFYWMPDVGEYVSFEMDENGEEGVIKGAFYSASDDTPVQDPNKFHVLFKDETYFEYDRKTHIFEAKFLDDALFRYDAEENKMTIEFSDKSLIEYDASSSKLHIHSQAQVNVQAVGQIRLKAPDIRLIKMPVPPR